MVKVISKEKAVGKVTKEKNGKTTETEEVVDEVVVDKPMANVGLKAGFTHSPESFESIRIDVSLFMPSETDEKSLNQTFKRVDKWVGKKLKKLAKEVGKI